VPEETPGPRQEPAALVGRQGPRQAPYRRRRPSLAQLSAIREVAILYPPGTLRARKDPITLSRMSARQSKLAEILDIASILAG